MTPMRHTSLWSQSPRLYPYSYRYTVIFTNQVTQKYRNAKNPRKNLAVLIIDISICKWYTDKARWAVAKRQGIRLWLWHSWVRIPPAQLSMVAISAAIFYFLYLDPVPVLAKRQCLPLSYYALRYCAAHLRWSIAKNAVLYNAAFSNPWYFVHSFTPLIKER